MEDTQSALSILTSVERNNREIADAFKMSKDILNGVFISQSTALKAQYEGQIATLTNQNGTLTQNLTDKTTENNTLSDTLREKTDLLTEKDDIIGELTTNNTTLTNLVNAIIDHINSKRDLESLPAITQDTLLEEITALI